MPKSEVRQAIANFLDPNISGETVTYLSNVYQALPKVANEADLFSLQPPGQGFGAVIYLFISRHTERLLTAPAIFGERKRVYNVGLLCIFKSDVAAALAGQEAFDEFIDSLTARIISDPQAGDPSVIEAWGVGDLTPGSSDLDFSYPVPKQLQGGVTLFQAIGKVTAVEVFQAD